MADKNAAVFAADKTANLIVRLQYNVIRAGLRRINLAYSRISLADVASRLGARPACCRAPDNLSQDLECAPRPTAVLFQLCSRLPRARFSPHAPSHTPIAQAYFKSTKSTRITDPLLPTSLPRAGLASVEDTECIVAKAIRDGGIDAVLDHGASCMLSRDTPDVYATAEPASAFHARVAFCLDIHNEVRACPQHSIHHAHSSRMPSIYCCCPAEVVSCIDLSMLYGSG